MHSFVALSVLVLSKRQNKNGPSDLTDPHADEGECMKYGLSEYREGESMARFRFRWKYGLEVGSTSAIMVIDKDLLNLNNGVIVPPCGVVSVLDTAVVV